MWLISCDWYNSGLPSLGVKHFFYGSSFVEGAAFESSRTKRETFGRPSAKWGLYLPRLRKLRIKQRATCGVTFTSCSRLWKSYRHRKREMCVSFLFFSLLDSHEVQWLSGSGSPCLTRELLNLLESSKSPPFFVIASFHRVYTTDLEITPELSRSFSSLGISLVPVFSVFFFDFMGFEGKRPGVRLRQDWRA